MGFENEDLRGRPSHSGMPKDSLSFDTTVEYGGKSKIVGTIYFNFKTGKCDIVNKEDENVYTEMEIAGYSPT
jgi:hypothetical protein